jgi:TonB-dependent starch-binding outer membrane protein SusC
MRKVLCLLVLTCMLAMQVVAQNRTITGTVLDVNNNPLPDISVSVKGTALGTTTKSDGSFSISVPASARVLTFSSVGYALQQVAIGSKSVISVQLIAEQKSIQEVVVVGYQQRKKRDEAGAISSIRGKEIENIPNLSIDKALQGRAAGVLVQANNGIPGGAINVRIRGTGSIQAGNRPLYIVDGVPLNTRDDANFTQANPLAFLNPNDIESIDILKDAASGAIYGAQASNGVVIVTTKKGKAGKTKFAFNAYAGVTQPLKRVKVLNAQDYYQVRVEALANLAGVPATIASAQLSGFNAQQFTLNELRVPGALTLNPAQAAAAAAALPTFNWQDAVLRNGVLHNYELSASGGNEKTQFYTSASYNAQEAILNKVDFKRMTLRLDLTNKVSDRVSFTSSINLSSFTQKIPFSVDGSFLGNPAFSSTLILPSNPIYNADGTYYGLPNTAITSTAGILNQNIVAVNDFNSGFQRTNQLIGNIAADFKIAKGVSFRSFYGLDYRIVQGKRITDPRTNDGAPLRGIIALQSSWNSNFLTTQTLNFNKAFGDRHKIDGVLGIEYRREVNDGITTSANGLPSFQFVTANAAANPATAGEFTTAYKLYSGLGALNYNFDDKYLLSFVFRYGGSSRFGNNFKYGFFPGFKAAWNLDREKFLINSEVVSDLKLRASWGQTGNDQIGNFDALGLYGTGPVYNGSAGIAPVQLPNPDLKWERNETSNIGIDYGFLNGRISGSVDVYNKLTKDLLITQPVQLTTGFAGFTSNVGQVENKGIEVGLQVTVIRPRRPDGFKWATNFNFTYNRNRVKKLYGGFDVLPSNVGIRVGSSLNTVFAQTYLGANPATGRPMWLDSLGNVTYQPLAKDRRVLGDGESEYFGGLTNTFTFKGLTLDIFFSYEYGRLISDGQANFLIENGGRTLNAMQEAFDKRWTYAGQLTSYPRPIANFNEAKGSSPLTASTRTFRKADYIRMKNVTLSYDFRPELLKKLKIASAKFYLQGSNLITYADWLGYDPEFVDSGNGATGIIPQTKNITFGIQIGF